eukprot:GFUD01018870.1.p1 GENE.GFUD01018870.1~~GFUD01018870.1.p1  ORF type:complete len:724 (-),score=245.32 GFUD01018870.1:141-2312(-)
MSNSNPSPTPPPLSMSDRLYIQTFNSLTSNPPPPPAVQADTYRRLAVQLGSNIARHGWDPLSSIAMMEEYIKAANDLVDDQNCLNNYADACLNESSKHTNHSSKWESKLSIEDPDIQAFIARHNSVDSGDGEDWPWRRCIKRELGVRSSSHLGSVEDKENSNSRNVEEVGVKKESIESEFKFSARAHSSTGLATTSVPPLSRGSEDNSMPSFDLSDSDLLEFSEPMDPESDNRPVAKSSTTSSTNLGSIINTNNPFLPRLSNASNLPNTIGRTSPFPPPPSFLNLPSFTSRPPTASTNLGLDSIPPLSRSNSIPPQSSLPGRPLHTAPTPPARQFPAPANQSTRPAGNTFRTAGQQLVIDRAREGKKDGITQNSYGSGKRNLGTRPGPAGGFKPPVRNVESEGGGLDREREQVGVQGEEEVDPRYKNIDMKMVELIKNEIMDAGEPITWDDIAGLEFAKEMVKEIVVWPMLRPDIFTGLRGPPKGLLLFGPPGTGKTLIGKCIACQSGSTFFSISASSLTSKWVGEGEKMVRALFAVAKVHQPSVVFIDEIDSLLTSRSEGEHESSRKIKTEFLVQLDGASTGGQERVLVVGATNRPQELDEAARRRLVKRLYIPLPEMEARRRIITNLLGKESHELIEEQVEEVSRLTEGYSGADMANVCKEAAMGPIRSLDFSQIASVRPDQVRPINHQDLLAALKQVKASVGQKDLELYKLWDKQFGAGR